jgi:hypothetical protein
VCEWDASRQKSKKGFTGKSEKERKKERKKKGFSDKRKRSKNNALLKTPFYLSE